MNVNCFAQEIVQNELETESEMITKLMKNIRNCPVNIQLTNQLFLNIISIKKSRKILGILKIKYVDKLWITLKRHLKISN